MKSQQTGLWLTAIASGLLCTASAQATTTLMIDTGLGTQVSSFNSDPGQPDNINVPIPGGALVTITSDGARIVVSDFGNAAQGPRGSGFMDGLSWMPSGLLGLSQTELVTDPFGGSNGAGVLFAVNPTTGQRRVLSDFGNPAQGPIGETPAGVAYGNGLLGLGSRVYVIDNEAGTNNSGALFAVDPATGYRTLLSDFGNAAQGPLGQNPIAIATVPAGLLSVLGLNAGLVVLDDDAGTNGAGAIFAINRAGQRTLLSDLGNPAQGPVAVGPQAITVTNGLLGARAILVTDNEAGTNAQGALFAIDTQGHRTLQSDFGNAAQGFVGEEPNGVVATADGSGNVLVTDDFNDQTPTQAQVFLVTPSGQRTHYNNCTAPDRGPCQAPAAIIQY